MSLTLCGPLLLPLGQTKGHWFRANKNVHVMESAAKVALLFVNCKLDFAKNAFLKKKV
jgi:hypothetical protein